MTPEDIMLFDKLVEVAARAHGGHFTICKFTTNWRVQLGTPMDLFEEAASMPVGKTFAAAASKALSAAPRP